MKLFLLSFSVILIGLYSYSMNSGFLNEFHIILKPLSMLFVGFCCSFFKSHRNKIIFFAFLYFVTLEILTSLILNFEINNILISFIPFLTFSFGVIIGKKYYPEIKNNNENHSTI